jgi:hypothetical protein
LLPVRASGLSQVPLADTQQHADVQRCLIVETEQTPVTDYKIRLDLYETNYDV